VPHGYWQQFLYPFRRKPKPAPPGVEA